MGCHTWITVRNKDLERHIRDKTVLRQEIIDAIIERRNFAQKMIHGEETAKLSKYSKPGDPYTAEWYLELIRYYNHLEYFVSKFSDDTILNLWFDMAKPSILDRMDTKTGKCWSNSDEFHDPFRYYNYDQEYKLKTLEDTWDFICNPDNHCYADFWDEDESYIGQLEYPEWTDKQKQEVYNRIKKIFDSNPETIIRFG